MQCPSCRSDIPDNQFYCPVCRASVYSYVPEGSRSSSGGRLERAGRRLLEVLLFLILIGIGVVLARAIKWKELLSGVLPATALTPTPKVDRPQSQPDSSGKRKAMETSSSKAAGEKSADSVKPASAESTSDKKQKEESPGESKPTPKPTPTPKPPSNY